MVEAQWRTVASVLQWLSGKRLIMAMQETEAKTNKKPSIQYFMVLQNEFTGRIKNTSDKK